MTTISEITMFKARDVEQHERFTSLHVHVNKQTRWLLVFPRRQAKLWSICMLFTVESGRCFHLLNWQTTKV